MKKTILMLFGFICYMISIHAETNLTLQSATANQMAASYDKANNIYSFTTTGTDPYVYTVALGSELPSTSINLTFDYISTTGIENIKIYYGNTFSEARSLAYGDLAASSDWKTATININYGKCKFFWGRSGQILRIDLGDASGKNIQIKNIRIADVTPNIKGKITVGYSTPLAGVHVSDGFVIATTDATGNYSFYSNKKSGHIFYEIPAGYMPYESYSTTTEQKVFAGFWEAINYPNTLSKVETHNFKVKAVENTNFRMIAGADPQIANKSNDVVTFNTLAFPRFREEIANAGTTPIYSAFMGDLAWDNYWYGSTNWKHSNYKSNLLNNNFSIRHFSVIGNHDHDGAIYNSDSVDYASAWSFRQYMGPNYFSFNIGKIHFISLDDIIYKNVDDGSSYRAGIVGTRNYTEGFSDLVVDWAQRDLANIDANTTVVVLIHAPMWYISNINQTTTTYNRTNQSAIEAALKRFKQVQVWSGHRHVTYNMNPTAYPNIMEKSYGACGGDLYAASYYSGLYVPSAQGVGRPVCSDGTPGGYQIFTFNGDDITWKFVGFENDNNGQFHVYDVNSIKTFCTTDTQMKAMISASSAYNFSSVADNSCIINVFNYDPQWKVEAFENGKSVSVSHYKCRDFYHMLAYDYYYYKKNGSIPSSDNITGYNQHSFLAKCSTANSPVKVQVTDRFGNVYTRTIQRPQEVSLDGMAIGNTEICTSINNTNYVAPASKIYTSAGKIIVDADKAGKAIITSVNGMSKTVSLTTGINTIDAPQKGLIIVTVNGQSKKLYIK